MDDREPWTTGTGQKLLVHNRKRCSGVCCIHAPSDHHMVHWPTNWRGGDWFDVNVGMERVCSHDIGHPDPDDRTISPLHGCDGCCSMEGMLSELLAD